MIKNKFKIEEKVTFPDHYEYQDKDLKNIKDLAQKKKLDIITTEKDFLRLKKRQKKNIKFLMVKLDINKKSKLEKILLEK